MKIKKIVLRDFRKYGGASFELGDGLNTITGHNGSGKSSILDAAYYALTGYLLRDGAQTANAIPYKSESDRLSVLIETEQDGISTSFERALSITRGEGGRVLSTSESGSIDYEDFQKTAFDREILSKLKIEHACFGLNPIRLCIDPHYIIDLCSSKDWKKARELILGLIDPQPFHKALGELPAAAKASLDGLDLGKGEDDLIADAAKSIKDLKASISTKTETLKNAKTGICPTCGEKMPESKIAELSADIVSLKKKLAKATEQKAALELAQTNSLVSISEETESRFGVRFDLYKENQNGTKEQCIVPYLPDGKPLKYGSQSEQIGAGIRIIKRASQVLGLPKLPLIIDEGGEITKTTLGGWGIGDWQIIMARADDIPLTIKKETI